MSVKLLTKQHLVIPSLQGGCRGSYESTLVIIPHCWKSHVMAHIKSTILHVYLVCEMMKFEVLYYQIFGCSVQLLCLHKQVDLQYERLGFHFC